MTFFTSSLQSSDAEVMATINREFKRQSEQIELIASENIVSKAVMEAQGSVMTNKYAEGYPGRRYYGGCEYVDEVENLARERAKQIFGCKFANVQPHSGSQANQAVFLSLLQPGDTILGMALDQGGHLTHGSSVNMSGKWFKACSYGIKEDGYIDFDALMEKAKECKPKLIIAGASAYPRDIDFAKFRTVADEVDAILMVDMAHIAGLVAVGAHSSVFPYADVATTTTHKTLRGPRGGMILTNNPEIAKKINSAIFPGLQGGPLMHVIAGKAVAFGEALQPEYKTYINQVVTNTKIMGQGLMARGYNLVSGGTDNHLILLDFRKQGISGKDAEDAMELAGLTCNKNSVPNDPLPPQKTSGLRLGAAATTSRGFKDAEFTQIAEWIADVLDAVATGNVEETAKKIRPQVKALCDKFPIYNQGTA